MPSTGRVAEQRVSTLELFFDLVFVFTLIQLTRPLADDLSPEGALRAALVFVVLFWMYGAYAWATNQVPPEGPLRQLLLVAGMAAFLVCALAIPDAFDGTGVIFGVGYLAAVLVHVALYVQVYGRSVAAFAPFNLASAAAVIVAGTVEPPLSYVLWLTAVAIHTVPAMLVRRSSRFELNAAHFAERHGLLLIIAFGESVTAIGIAVGHADLDAGTVTAAVLTLMLAAAMWSLFFAHDEASAQRMLASASSRERIRAAHFGYFYAFIAMLFGIVVMAAGIKKSLGHFTEQLETEVAITLAAGVALYLLGELGFRLVLRLGHVRFRAVGAAAAIATITLGEYVSGGAQLVTLVALVGAVVVAGER